MRGAALLLAIGVAASATAQQAAPGPAAVPSVAAVIAATPKNLPRARAPSLADAIAAAQAAHATCTALGVKVSVLVADAAGETVVLLSGDGAGVRSQLIARTKVAIVARYGVPSGDVAARAEHDPTLVAAAAADPNIGVLRGGGFPVVTGGSTLAIVAVSGGSLGGVMGLDERCALVAVERLRHR